eukprot:gene16655-22767_t
MESKSPIGFIDDECNSKKGFTDDGSKIALNAAGRRDDSKGTGNTPSLESDSKTVLPSSASFIISSVKGELSASNKFEDDTLNINVEAKFNGSPSRVSDTKVPHDDLASSRTTAVAKSVSDEIRPSDVKSGLDSDGDDDEDYDPLIAEHIRKFVNGFVINYMVMRDGTTGVKKWQSGMWDTNMFVNEIQENVPKEILECKRVTREINFTSKEKIEKFRLQQRVVLNGICVEEWFFTFGFVIPGSTNSWEQTIEAAANMWKPEDLSGNVVFETLFFDDNIFLCRNSVRIFYV